MRKLGIYVQVPFCQTKCTYCNFHTGVVASSRFAPYVEAVCREIREHRDLLGAAWVGAGINRVRFGLQSFADKELIAAGRMHRRADIYRAVPILRKAGIGNISFDLIAGLPHQTKESWRQSLDELAVLAPEHVSVYLLEIDEGSRLGKELLQSGGRYSAGAAASEAEMGECYGMAAKALGAAGYRLYEL